MSSRFERLEQLFHQALALSAEARGAFLEEACRDDPPLKLEVERLLDAHDRAGRFIQVPAATLATAQEPSQGRRIGPYRVVRELGRGGMGAVYLAERADGGFAQRVAIKLIKRGMDTDHVLARFRAERQILASLDHPNIARLLDGGSTDDGLPYLVMEYIDGQPIDAFADQRQLTVADRLRLFLQVCDAVSHAHGHGVVHRDIKPLNILVTPTGTPKLLDFGIAKVLVDAADEVTSTVTGLRLLTPEYASPEQIEGRHATTASDVYSLGVVLYELLTGRSPYRLQSRALQDVAAAVCTTEPDRPSTAVTRAPEAAVEGMRRRRQDSLADHAGRCALASPRQLSRLLRGDLDTIVLAALRKEPGRRYASVAAMAEDLRRHLTGRPVVARSEALWYRAGKFVRRNRAAVAAGVVSLAAATVLGLGVRARAADAVPTLLASRAIERRDRILVADLTDRTGGDSVLTSAVTDMVRTDLGQSPVIRVLTARQVRTSLEMMQRSADVVLDDTLAREVALREGVKAFVTGSLARLSGSYILTLQLVGAQEGEALAAVRETAADSSKLIAAVDRASKALRRTIGESLREMRQTLPLDQATTFSLAALREYTQGMRAFRAGRRTAAIDHLNAAVAIDTGFATAWSSLSMIHGAMANPGQAFEAQRHLFANRHRLTFLERSFQVASRAYAREDFGTAIRIYRDVVDRYPDHVPALNNLALAYRDSRRYAEADTAFRRAIQADSTIANMYFGLHSVYLLEGNFARARSVLDTTTQRFPGHPILLTEEIQDAAAQQDWDRTERQARAQITEAGTDTMRAVDPVEALAGVAMTRGQLAEAERRWHRQLGYTRAANVMSRHLFGVIQLGYLYLRHRSDRVRALHLVDSATAALGMERLLPGDRRYDELARFYAAAGDLPRARTMLARAIADDSILGRDLRSERSWTLGVLDLADGRAAEAVTELRRAAELHVCAICPLPDLGRALEATGKAHEAVQTYDRYLSTPWMWRYEPDAVELGWTYRRAAELHEDLGERDEARQAYSRLLALWADADPPLRAVLADVRSRRAALSQEAVNEQR